MSKRDFTPGHWNHGGEAVPLVRAGHGDRGAELEWRAQADEGGCADWGLAFARIPAAPDREQLTGRERVMAVVALVLIAVGSAALLIAEGQIVWPL